MHNDYDYRCVEWYGDRSPGRNRHWISNILPGTYWKPVELTHREMDGSETMFNNSRCLVCNPYTEKEAVLLLGWTDE